MISKEIKNEDYYLPENSTLLENDLIETIKTYSPDIIAFSILEIMYDNSIRISNLIKKEFKEIPIIAGGVFPTLSPEVVIEEPSIDMVCIGEGETAMLELADRISKKKPYDTVEGFWVKKENDIIKNKPSKLHDINQIPFPDFSEFDKRLFYKPMQGKMYRMVNIETSRGCPNNCSYCAAPALKFFFKNNECGRYYRNMDMKKVIEQIGLQIKRHSPEFIYFSSENFLSMNDNDFNLFIQEYEKIKIPFWIQTRVETFTKERISNLKRVGMHWLTIGLEHGNEEFRTNVLKRHYTNAKFIEKMNILKEAGIGASINNMIGFPSETRELIFDTINLNKLLWEQNNNLETNVFLFTPYKGCELYTLCKSQGLLGDNIPYTNTSNMNEKSVLNFSEEFQNDLIGLIRTFNLYVKLPEQYYDQIKIAEKPTKEGDEMLNKLKHNLLKS
jgi:anaerobic magnesium-protoporphyrin IX monomethyl ester cyclase